MYHLTNVFKVSFFIRMQANDILSQLNVLQQKNQLLKAKLTQYEQQISQQPIMLIPVLQVHQPITIQPQINNPLIQL